MKYLILLLAVVIFSGCNNEPKPVENIEYPEDSTQTEPIIKKSVEFNQENAYLYVQSQVDFGPRVPGTKTHLECYNYLLKHFQGLADTVFVQNTTAVTFDKKTIPVKNIIAAFNPEQKKTHHYLRTLGHSPICRPRYKRPRQADFGCQRWGKRCWNNNGDC